MKAYYFLLILFLITYIRSETNCEDINSPSKSSDCKLSSEEQKTKKYCCFLKSRTITFCEAQTNDEELEKRKEELKSINESGVDKIEIECNSSSSLKMGLIIFLLTLL